jgi:uncharacterized tellurite resistance protein B-like protein
MNAPNNQNFTASIETIFSKHQQALTNYQQKQKGKKHASKSELEFALTVLLVELASSDQNFDTSEYNIIVSGLKRMFGTDRTQVSTIISQATAALANLRGSSSYGQLLKENLSKTQRENILEIVADVISADGQIDGYEIYVRNKIAKLLDLTPPAT